jgi:hypothetical protein
VAYSGQYRISHASAISHHVDVISFRLPTSRADALFKAHVLALLQHVDTLGAIVNVNKNIPVRAIGRDEAVATILFKTSRCL